VSFEKLSKLYCVVLSSPRPSLSEKKTEERKKKTRSLEEFLFPEIELDIDRI